MLQKWIPNTMGSVYLVILSVVVLMIPCISDVGAVYQPAFELKPWSDFVATILLMPAGFECFFQDSKIGNVLHFEYQLAGQDTKPSVNALVTDPHGNVLYQNQQSTIGTFNHKAEVTGAYKFCLGNNYQKYYVKYVKMYLSATDNERLDKYYQVEDDILQSYGNLSKTLTKLTMSVRVMRRYQQWSGIREARDKELLEANSSYVTTWSSLQCLVVMGAAAVQVFVLRSFFNTAKLTPSQKPRC